MRRAPRGLVPPAAPGGAHKPGWGDAQQVPLIGSRSEMQKRSLLPPGRAGSHDKMVPFWTRAAVARWQGQGSGWPGPEEGAGPTGGRLRLAGARQPAGSWAGRSAAGASALTLTPTRAHSQLLLLQEAGGGWCIKGEAPPNRVSSPRTLPQQRWWPRQRLRLLSAAVGRTQPPTRTWAASIQLRRLT